MRRFASRGRRLAPPSRQWSDISETWSIAAAVSTSAVVLFGLESPSPSAALTALPPADIVLMRIRGQFQVTVAGPGNWVLALTVQDKAWTPSSLFRTDADKRIFWARQFDALESTTWLAPGHAFGATTQIPFGQVGMVDLDISPKVKLEAGQGLNLVAYEVGGATTLTTTSQQMRVLWQQKRAA